MTGRVGSLAWKVSTRRLEDGDGDVGVGRVVDLVAGGPEDDAGVVAVAQDGVGGVADGPVFEVEVVVVGVLGDGPAVEHLVHDEEAHAVGEVEELGRGRVVGGADGVDAERAEGGEAAFPGGERDGGAEGAGVGVQGYAVDLVVDAVEEEAWLGSKWNSRMPKGTSSSSMGLPLLQEGDVGGVEGAVVEVPAVGVGDGGVVVRGRRCRVGRDDAGDVAGR